MRPPDRLRVCREMSGEVERNGEDKKDQTPVQDNPTRCQFYVTRKRRFCKLTRIGGHPYCGEHFKPTDDPKDAEGAEPKKRRIVCPLDPKHTCYESKLESHLKKCNAREGPKPAYYSAHVNSGEDEDPEGAAQPAAPLQIGKMADEQLLAFLEKVKKAHELKRSKFSKEERFTTHALLVPELEKMENCAGATKHLSQSAAILGNMEDVCLLSEPGSFVEFGAGRGGMSYWLAKIFASPDRRPVSVSSSLLLVDRASQRHKFDNKLKDGPDAVDGLKIVRIKADIEHLVLDEALSECTPSAGCNDESGKVVAFSKHLCGVAADFALRCLANSKAKAKAVCLATCCHHRCVWKGYVGKGLFKDLSFDAVEFRLVTALTSWLTCGLKKHSEEGSMPEPEAQADKRYTRMGLTIAQREEIGRMCKDLIDIGRMEYLSSKGFPRVSWCQYIKEAVTPENVLLMSQTWEETK